VIVLQPKNKTFLIAKNQSSKDIVAGINRSIKESKEDAKKICTYFEDPDPIKSCSKVWHYLKDHLLYVREGSDEQTAKSLAKVFSDKYGDCKHYSSASYSILSALNIPVKLRLVSQKIANKEPTHIYTIAVINGKEIIIDPVMNEFNQECNYKYKCDLTNKNMMNYMNGVIDNAELGKIKKGSGKKLIKKLTDAKKKENEKIKKAFLDAKKKHDALLKKGLVSAVKNVKKFAHIKKDVAVKSFLWSVSKNYMGLADRLKDANKSHHADLVKFWGAFGSFQDLANAVNKGSKKGATFSGVNYRSDRSNLNSSYMGEEGGSGDQAKQYEEGAKASVGIIKQILDFFAKRKKDKQAGDDQSVSTLEEAVNDDPSIPKVDASGNPIAEGSGEGSGDTEETPFYKKPLVIVSAVGLVGAGLYFMNKKK